MIYGEYERGWDDGYAAATAAARDGRMVVAWCTCGVVSGGVRYHNPRCEMHAGAEVLARLEELSDGGAS